METEIEWISMHTRPQTLDQLGVWALHMKAPHAAIISRAAREPWSIPILRVRHHACVSCSHDGGQFSHITSA